MSIIIYEGTRRVDALRALRKVTGLGLNDAKDAVTYSFSLTDATDEQARILCEKVNAALSFYGILPVARVPTSDLGSFRILRPISVRYTAPTAGRYERV